MIARAPFKLGAVSGRSLGNYLLCLLGLRSFLRRAPRCLGEDMPRARWCSPSIDRSVLMYISGQNDTVWAGMSAPHRGPDVLTLSNFVLAAR
jgi:hypothetical protein